MAIDAALRPIYLPWQRRAACSTNTQYAIAEPVDFKSVEQCGGCVPETHRDRGQLESSGTASSKFSIMAKDLTGRSRTACGPAILYQQSARAGFRDRFISGKCEYRAVWRQGTPDQSRRRRLHPSYITPDTAIDMTTSTTIGSG